MCGRYRAVSLSLQSIIPLGSEWLPARDYSGRVNEESPMAMANANGSLKLFVTSAVALVLAIGVDSQALRPVLGPLENFSEIVHLAVLGVLLYAVGRSAASVGTGSAESA